MSFGHAIKPTLIEVVKFGQTAHDVGINKNIKGLPTLAACARAAVNQGMWPGVR